MRKKEQNKHSLIVVGVLLCICLLIYFIFPVPPCSLSDFEKRAVWVSYQELSELSYESKKEFTKDFQDILDEVVKYETNTLIVHARAFADALYPSKLFPISQIICQRSSLSFDPLEVMIDLTHQKGLKFEAWLNPYRISLNQETFENFLELSPKSEWLEDTKQTIGYKTYKYIFNPQSQDVRDYIVAGVKEIVENYDVDGIHFDDYFYVEGTHEYTSRNQRMDNVNMLIQDIYASIKEINKDVTFGISPQGNYENCINEGADIDTWLKEEGYIDYLMPQIYWSNRYGERKHKLFNERAKQFAGLKKHKNVKLYAGLALYRAGEDNEIDKGWTHSSSNISSQVQILYVNGYKGYSFFTYDSLKNKAAQKELKELLKNHPLENEG